MGEDVRWEHWIGCVDFPNTKCDQEYSAEYNNSDDARRIPGTTINTFPGSLLRGGISTNYTLPIGFPGGTGKIR